MSIKHKELTIEGGVNLEDDPHILKSNEWQLLQNIWPYKSKLPGTRPSLLHEMDILPVDKQYWNGYLYSNNPPITSWPAKYPSALPYYYQWFRHLTPLKAVFMGELSKLALICVCNKSDSVNLYEQFEGEAPTLVTLKVNDVVLIIMPNDIRPGPGAPGLKTPSIAGVRLGQYSNITPSLLEFNGAIIAANKSSTYVVKVVKSTDIAIPSATLWPGIDYRFTKIDFGPTNAGFAPWGVVTYKNRFVYFKGNKLWFSDPFQPELIYDNAEATAYLGVFFESSLTEDITAAAEIYTSTLDTAGTSVLAIWTAHGMLMVQGEPATTIASTPEELFSQLNVTRIPLTSGCISQASIVKTKHGIVWCGADTVWFMARGGLPVEVGRKISSRVKDQSLESAGRIFATFDDECYRVVINAPGVGFNPYEALNEMWCLSFIGDAPSKESAAWFGPQVFSNTDNIDIVTNANGGAAGLYCCAKMVTTNDDRTWYIQPYSCHTGETVSATDIWGTRLGLATLTTYYGVDITAPFRPTIALDDTYAYGVGDQYHLARGKIAEPYPYNVDYVVVDAGVYGGALVAAPMYINSKSEGLYSKRPLMAKYEAVTGASSLPKPYKIKLQSANLTLDNPELKKLIDGFEITFKTLNPVILNANWWPWEPEVDPIKNVVVLESKANIPAIIPNLMGGLFNEPVLTARRVPPPVTQRYNGLTAQLNLTQGDYKIIHGAGTKGAYSPVGIIRMSRDNVTWLEFNILNYVNGISKYAALLDLATVLHTMSVSVLAELDISVSNVPGYGFRLVDESALFIDTSAQGWEWFGIVPTNQDYGWGKNIISNALDGKEYLFSNGPVPPCTPQSIHLAKLTVRYALLSARPR